MIRPMSEDTARALWAAVTANIDAEAETIFLKEIGEPATADVGNRFAARAEALRKVLTKEARRRGEARAGVGMEAAG